MDKDILKAILEFLKNQVTLFLLIGVLLVLAAANGGYAKIGVSFPSTWSNIIGFLGGILVVVAILSLLFKTEERRTNRKVSKKYGIKITFPVNSTPLYCPITISGEFKKIPPIDNIYAVEFNPATLEYWPKRRLNYNVGDKTWTSEMNIGNGDNKPRILIIAYVGKDSLRLIDYYRKSSVQTGRHIGFDAFPADFQCLSETKVTPLKPNS